MMKTILIVDDEQDILDLLQFNLKAEGYQILTAKDGEMALELAKSSQPDLIILDIMLPGKDGWEVIRELRTNEETQHLPVIFLTAKDSEIDEVVGLELGADDYMVKPISMRKLLARIKTALRKSKSRSIDDDEIIKIGDLQINPQNHQVKIAGSSIVLTKKEFALLTFLAKRPGRVITRNILLDEIWGEDVFIIDRTIDVHVRKIREKLGPEYMKVIETIKGVGYRFKAED
jgi:two-component system alkaline phosphatase synthesis response regulator PhoP